MRIRWRQFERSMRPRLREYDARTRMTIWERFFHFWASDPTIGGNIAVGLGAALAVAAIIGLWQTIEPNSSGWLNVLSLLGLITATARAGIIQQISAVDRQYLTLWFLPLTPSEIARIIVQRMLINSAIIFGLFMLVYGPMSLHGRISLAAGLFCAALQVLISLALSGWLIALKIPQLGQVIIVIFFGILMVTDTSNMPTAQAWANALNPFAWMNIFYVETFLKHSPAGWKWLAATLGLIATLPATALRFRKLHDAGAFRNKVILQRGRYIIEPETKTAAPVPLAITPANLSKELSEVNWNSFGLIERLLAQVLKPREKLIAEALLSGSPTWSSNFRRLIFWFVLFLIFNRMGDAERFANFANATTRDLREFWFVASIVVGLLGALATTGLMTIRLFEWTRWPEQSTAVRKGLPVTFRMLPFSYWDLALVIAKVNAVIGMLLIPIVVLFSFSPAWLFVEENIFHTTIWVAPALAIVWSASFLLPALRFTPSLEDGLRYWLAVLRDCLAYILLAVAGVAAIGAPHFRILFVAAFIGGSVAWFRYIGKRYNAGHY